MTQNANTIILKDEEGKDIEFEVITKFDIEDNEYIIVIPSESDEEEAIALKIIKDDNGEEVLVTIENNDEFKKVEEAYELLLSKEDYNS